LYFYASRDSDSRRAFRLSSLFFRPSLERMLFRWKSTVDGERFSR